MADQDKAAAERSPDAPAAARVIAWAEKPDGSMQSVRIGELPELTPELLAPWLDLAYQLMERARDESCNLPEVEVDCERSGNAP